MPGVSRRTAKGIHVTPSVVVPSTRSLDEGFLLKLGRRLDSRRATTDAPPMIEARGLDVSYGLKRALEDVSLEIPRNRITAFIGPSGCGKSTALRCFNRMNDDIPSFKMRGSISVAGQDINGKGVNLTALRRAVGMVFQQPNPFPMSVYDNIALAVREQRGRVGRDELDHIVQDALKRSSLWDEVKHGLKDSAFSLSGGQQQRLCIARALAVTPAVLMLDEPCASLDPISTAKIEELLLELSADYTIVIVTHNLAQAHRISDQVAFFLMGRLVEVGPATEIFDTPQFGETANYIQGRFG
jgi:phosphate transport system ATP-binding protein